MATLFLSHDLPPGDPLFELARAARHELVARSCLRYTALDFAFPQNPDWLFAYSANGVRGFLAKAGVHEWLAARPQLRFAAIGAATAGAFRQNQLHVHFEGGLSANAPGNNIEQTESVQGKFKMKNPVETNVQGAEKPVGLENENGDDMQEKVQTDAALAFESNQIQVDNLKTTLGDIEDSPEGNRTTEINMNGFGESRETERSKSTIESIARSFAETLDRSSQPFLGQRVCYIQAEHSRASIEKLLSGTHLAETLVCYRMEDDVPTFVEKPLPGVKASLPLPDRILLTSPRSAKLVLNQLTERLEKGQIQIYTIGETTQIAVQKLGYSVADVGSNSIASLVEKAI